MGWEEWRYVSASAVASAVAVQVARTPPLWERGVGHHSHALATGSPPVPPPRGGGSPHVGGDP